MSQTAFEQPSQPGALTFDEICDIVGDFIADNEVRLLSPAQREAVALRRKGLSQRETAIALGVSQHAVLEALNRAKAKGVLATRGTAP
jgi:DNA-binding CsgD family transcriptional regulator